MGTHGVIRAALVACGLSIGCLASGSGLLGRAVASPPPAEGEAVAAEAPPAGGTESEHVFRLVAPSGVVLRAARVTLEAADGTHVVPLADDGTSPQDTPYDGTYEGRWQGGFTRSLNLQVEAVVGDAEEPAVLFAGHATSSRAPVEAHAWRVVRHEERWQAVQTATTLTGPIHTQDTAFFLYGFLAWGVLVLAWVGALACGAGSREQAP